MKRLGLIAAAAGTVLLLGLHQDVAAARAANSSNNADTYKQLNLFGDVFELVRNDYVDEVKDDTLVEGAINGMLTALDPHSNYLNSKNFTDMKVQTRGEFGGLGIEVSMESGLVKVVSPIDDTPAARAGQKRHQPDRAPREPGAIRRQADSRDHQDPVGPLASRRQEYRLYPRHLVQRADRCRPQQCDEEPEAAGR